MNPGSFLDGLEAAAYDAEAAAGIALAALRTKLGWHSDGETRTPLLAPFSAVDRTVFASLDANEKPPVVSLPDALRTFETWYAENHTTPFWTLSEYYIPETPLVDF